MSFNFHFTTFARLIPVRRFTLTILSLLVTVGENCERMMETIIQGVPASHVQCDEIWGFVGMKEKTRKGKEGEADTLGDAWCFVGMETATKLILAWHLGRRTADDTVAFTEKLASATADHSFQISTDGFTAYKDAVVLSLGAKRVDFAQVIKIYGILEGDEKRYSPSEVLETKKTVVFGNPDLRIAGTSHIERQNLTIRMSMRRMTRLTNAFSKKWRNLKASYALHFAYYNFCRIHSTIKCTPGMEAGLTKTIWSLKDLVEISGAYAE